MVFEWRCPKCTADANAHGKGGFERCKDTICRTRDACQGFLCECEEPETSETHGQTLADRCTNAVCSHCGWTGTFPVKPKNLQAWEKTALKAGWMPPEKRALELKGKGSIDG